MDEIASMRLEDGELRLQFVKFEPHPVHKAPTYFFRMVHAQTGAEMGGINLRAGSSVHIERYAGHIGYTVLPEFRGHHYAARSVVLLAPVARILSVNVIWITCDPENLSSRRSAELAGAQFVEIVEVPENCVIHQTGHRRKCRYRLDV